jgi:hypothetical protein
VIHSDFSRTAPAGCLPLSAPARRVRRPATTPRPTATKMLPIMTLMPVRTRGPLATLVASTHSRSLDGQARKRRLDGLQHGWLKGSHDGEALTGPDHGRLPREHVGFVAGLVVVDFHAAAGDGDARHFLGHIHGEVRPLHDRREVGCLDHEMRSLLVADVKLDRAKAPYNPNGNVSGGAIQFATLTTHPVIHDTDFIVIA